MHLIDPLTDNRWGELVNTHPAACAFHTVGWLRTLSATYGYEPLVVTSNPPGEALLDGLPFCRIASWATGRRLVSLPFSDHCQPLVSSHSLSEMVSFLTEVARSEKDKFVELRPAASVDALMGERYRVSEYAIHWLDVTQPLEKIFATLHKDSIQRKVRRAEREKLHYECGRSAEIINKFYNLLLKTRRRHGLPPQPRSWFRNLATFVGDAVQFRIASKDEIPIAATVTLKHRNSLVYKYGCSDARHHAAGGMPFLFWKMIEDASASSVPLIDFGRSDFDNPGLIRFKDQWGTRRTNLAYYRFPLQVPLPNGGGAATRVAKQILGKLPDKLLEMIGDKIYRHIG